MEENSAKPPPFTIVGKGAESAPNPPRKLGEAGESLWFRVQNEYRITDVGGVELLMQACFAAGRAEALRVIIDADGERTVAQRGVIKDEPRPQNQLSARGFFLPPLL